MLEFIESTLFEKYRGDYLSDDEFAGLQFFLAVNPDAGDLIPGSGGCRKIRWGTANKGKRGGVRVIYPTSLRTDLVADYLREEQAGKHRRRCTQGAQRQAGGFMKRITQKVLARDSKRDIGAEVLQAVTEIKSGKGRRYALAIPEAARARQSIGVTQSEFAVMLGVSVRTLQDWEQGRREPSGAAKSLLRVAAAAPRVVRKVLDMA